MTKTCCITGHREIPADKRAYVEAALREEVAAAIADGYTRFLSGFAQGVDLIFATIVAEEKEQHPDLFLEAAIPYAGRLKAKDELFQRLIRSCNGIKVSCKDYTPNCYMTRNRYMVSESQRVIAVYDGRDSGGTLFTIRDAHCQSREIRMIEI